MESEVLRDSLLHVAGVLDLTLGGPDIPFDQGLTSHRRSLYYTHHGEATMPFLALFDAPDPGDCYRRTTSVVPQQSLALPTASWPSPSPGLWRDASGRMSRPRPIATPPSSSPPSSRSSAVPRPTRERALSDAFLARQADLAPRRGRPPSIPRNAAREDLVQALLNHNDFLTIH